jgi:Holliday junction resolvase RusA-like endonuclease
MPNSWSNKKRLAMDGTPHTLKRKCDIDNLVKGFMDILFDDDGDVWDIRASKFWSRTGAIDIITSDSSVYWDRIRALSSRNLKTDVI